METKGEAGNEGRKWERKETSIRERGRVEGEAGEGRRWGREREGRRR